MNKYVKKRLICGCVFLMVFALWTKLVCVVDVKPWGANGSNVGFASVNIWFYSVTGTNMTLYSVTDWLGLVPVAVCFVFAVMGLVQLVKRKSLLKVDVDIILTGIYYIVVFAFYFIFEMIPINYRPVLINGIMEASYPSSTTLLVLSVMPALVLLTERKLKSLRIKKIFSCTVMFFSAFMVTGRLVSGVHWLTDIIGAVILSTGLFEVYKSAVLFCDKN